MEKVDNNEVRLTGSIGQLKKIGTRSGAPMVEFILKVRRDRFRIVAHGNVAEHLLAAVKPEDRLTVTGTLSTSSWKDEVTGEWRNSFAVTAWAVEVHGDKIAFKKKQQSAPASAGGGRYQIPMAQADDVF